MLLNAVIMHEAILNITFVLLLLLTIILVIILPKSITKIQLYRNYIQGDKE